MITPGFGEIAGQLRRATVQVRIDQGRTGAGSGVVWNRQGQIVSNAHVIRGENVEVEFWDGDVVKATRLRRDARRDLALIEVTRSPLPAPVWADSSQLKTGDPVLAVGNPLGFHGALSTGVVHSVGPHRQIGSQNWVQARILLAPGNSGGALANASGAVVGINTMVAGPLGLAVPSSEVASFVKRALLPEAPPIPGVTIETISFRHASRLALGLRIQQIEPGSKAQLASLLPGDVIIGADGKFFSSPDDLFDRLGKGGLVQLEFLRGGKPVPREVAIPLGPIADRGLSAAA